VDKRTEEMLELNKLITKYTETYVRPSLSDIYAFDIILNLINEDPEMSDHVVMIISTFSLSLTALPV